MEQLAPSSSRESEGRPARRVPSAGDIRAQQQEEVRSDPVRNGTTGHEDVFEDDDHPAGPTINTIPASPAVAQETAPPPTFQDGKVKRRQSFHPPPLNTAFSREVLLTSRTGVLPGAGLTVADSEGGEDAILQNVEDMLEGFDWTATAVDEYGRKKGSADAIEARLLDELGALESVSARRGISISADRKANIHAFLESDDRIAQVLGHIDEALLELEDIDLQITGYRMQLNVRIDCSRGRKLMSRRSLMTSRTSSLRTEVCRSRPRISKHCWMSCASSW